MVELLLAEEAEYKYITTEVFTLLHSAALGGSLRIVQLIVDKVFDIYHESNEARLL